CLGGKLGDVARSNSGFQTITRFTSGIILVALVGSLPRACRRPNALPKCMHGGTRMIRASAWRILAAAGLACGLILAAPNAPDGEAKATADRVVLSRSLPAMKGTDLKITVVEVA